jgi:attachment invasion locus protein
MKIFFKSALAAALIVAGAAQAQSTQSTGAYGEIGYTFLNLTATSGGDTAKASPGLLTGTLGYKVHPNFAVEAFVGFGANKDGIKLNGASTVFDAEANSSYGIFFRPSFALSDKAEVFGRIGYVKSKASISAGAVSVSDRDTDGAYGLGLNYAVTNTSYLQLNWTTLYKKDGLKADGFGLVYGIRF